jgi:hypothetical protein
LVTVTDSIVDSDRGSIRTETDANDDAAYFGEEVADVVGDSVREISAAGCP